MYRTSNVANKYKKKDWTLSFTIKYLMRTKNLLYLNQGLSNVTILNWLTPQIKEVTIRKSTDIGKFSLEILVHFFFLLLMFPELEFEY
jgi:hypothetical protein